MSFGKRLQELRNESNLSRNELADILKLTYSAVSKYESDKRFPDQNTLNLIANYFDVSTDYLLGRIDYSQIEKNPITFGERLKMIREEQGLTQEEVSSVLCVGRSTVAGYETKGKQPDYEKLLKLSVFLGVSIDYLLGKDEKINTLDSSLIFGNRLRELIENKGMEGKEFADAMHVKPPTISNWLNGKRFPSDRETLVNIANFFNVSVDYLLGNSNSRNLECKRTYDIRELLDDIDYNHLLNALKIIKILKKDFDKENDKKQT